MRFDTHNPTYKWNSSKRPDQTPLWQRRADESRLGQRGPKN